MTSEKIVKLNKKLKHLTKIYYPDLTRSSTDTHTHPHAHTLTHIYEYFV